MGAKFRFAHYDSSGTYLGAVAIPAEHLAAPQRSSGSLGQVAIRADHGMKLYGFGTENELPQATSPTREARLHLFGGDTSGRGADRRGKGELRHQKHDSRVGERVTPFPAVRHCAASRCYVGERQLLPGRHAEVVRLCRASVIAQVELTVAVDVLEDHGHRAVGLLAEEPEGDLLVLW